jgi:SpoIID/LytB domain protein
MRYDILVKVSLYLLLSLLCVSAQAADYVNGELFLEVNLASGDHIRFKPVSSSNPSFTVTEESLPVVRDVLGEITVGVVSGNGISYWGILKSAEPWSEQEEGYKREYFAWQDSCLVIKRENLIFEDTSFTAPDAAKSYIKANRIPESKLMNIPLINSTVSIISANGDQLYCETPLKIHTDTPVSLSGSDLAYSGDFIVKCVNGQLVINHFLPLEEYVGGVIQNEIGNNAPLEALKAQAVSARTHAISLLLYNRHKDDGYDLCNSTHCQVYKGKYLLNDAILQAVSETKDQIMTYQGKVIDATYSSCCGGKTDSSQNIWNGLPKPYLMGSVCIPEAGNYDLSLEKQAREWIDSSIGFSGMSSWEQKSLSWRASISRYSLASNLGLGYVNRIVIAKRGYSGRITDMYFLGSGTVHLTSEYKIRQAFGGTKSSFFYITGEYSQDGNGNVTVYPHNTMFLRGRGSGHGVGMCQVGTLRRARMGEDYQKILTLYYPGIDFVSNWKHDAR